MSEGQKPVWKAKAGGFDVSVWVQEGKFGTYNSASLKKSYMDKDKNWKDMTINGIRVNDIAKLEVLLSELKRELLLNKDSEKAEE